MAKKWIKAATENAHGQFKAKAERAGESTEEFAQEHLHSSGKLGRQARLAETLMSMHKGKKEDKPKHTRPTVRGLMKKMHGTKE